MSLKTAIQNKIRALTLRTRLTILYTTVFAGFLIFSSGLTAHFLSNILKREFDDALFNYAVDISEKVFVNAEGEVAINSKNVDKDKIFPFALGESLIQVRHISGELLSQVGDFTGFQIPFEKSFKKITKGEDAAYENMIGPKDPNHQEEESEKINYRLIHFALDGPPNTQLVLQIAAPMSFLEEQLSRRMGIFLWTVPIVILVTGFICWHLVGRALRPVRQIIEVAQRISPTDFDFELPLSSAKDEIWLLSQTLNQMFLRLKDAFLSQERFVADASHQLLTPLTILKAEFEQVLPKADSELQVSLRSGLEEIEHLIRLVKDLLILARTDAGNSSLSLQNISLIEVATEAVAKAQKLANKKNIKIKVDLPMDGDSCLVFADSDLLLTMIFNLLENAIKYSPAESQLSLVLVAGDKYQILISDQGPGIAGDPNLIFARFHRTNSSSNIPGFGLGLAIAQKIAQLHGTNIKAQNRVSQKGAEFSFEIKKN